MLYPDLIINNISAQILAGVLGYIKEGAITLIRILLSTRLGEQRMTQAELARRTGIRPNTIGELYHEMADRVNLEHLDLICKALHCNLNELIVNVPDKMK